VRDGEVFRAEVSEGKVAPCGVAVAIPINAGDAAIFKSLHHQIWIIFFVNRGYEAIDSSSSSS
jgi:hypothetical protein